MGSMQRERQPSMQREDEANPGNEPGTNSSESAVNHLSKSVVRDTEGAAKQKPHATFCGNRGRATAPGDPVVLEKYRRKRQLAGTLLYFTHGSVGDWR